MECVCRVSPNGSTSVQVMACAVRYQAITWINVDQHLCHQMVSWYSSDVNDTTYISNKEAISSNIGQCYNETQL